MNEMSDESLPHERSEQILLYERLFIESQQPSTSAARISQIRVTLNRIKLALGYGIFQGSHERMMAEVARIRSEQKQSSAD